MVRTERRRYAGEDSGIKERIVLAVANTGKPLTLSEIENKTGITRQLIRYHIPSLISNGVLLPIEHDGKRFYSAQLPFISDEVFDSMVDMLSSIVDKVSENLVFNGTSVPRESIVKNNLKILVDMIRISL